MIHACIHPPSPTHLLPASLFCFFAPCLTLVPSCGLTVALSPTLFAYRSGNLSASGARRKFGRDLVSTERAYSRAPGLPFRGLALWLWLRGFLESECFLLYKALVVSFFHKNLR